MDARTSTDSFLFGEYRFDRPRSLFRSDDAGDPVPVTAERHEPAPLVSAEEPPSAACATQAAERRLLTVMVCFLSLGTEPPTRLDPEKRHGISAALRTCYSEICGRHGDVPGPVVGDTVFIYFGLPVAHEHDGEQAIRAGLAVIAAMQRLDWGLAIRIGIATGLVVVGEVLGKGRSRNRRSWARRPISPRGCKHWSSREAC
jgi:class 3 adenylate cyclase